MTLSGTNIQFSLLESVHRIISPVQTIPTLQTYPESCYISRKTKAAGLPPYRLMFIFSQRRRHDCHRAFSLLESVHRIISPVQTIPTLQTYPESCYISRKTKAAGLPLIPLDVYFLPTQTARLPQGVFSTRICASNRSASVKPIRKATASTKSKAVQFSPIPLVVYFFPTQTARLPQGVFSARICASNYFASTDNSNLANLSGKLLHLTQNKRGRASTIPLDVYLFPKQTARLPQGVFSTRICASNRSANAN